VAALTVVSTDVAPAATARAEVHRTRSSVIFSPMARSVARQPTSTSRGAASGQQLVVTVRPGPLEVLEAPDTITLARVGRTRRFRSRVARVVVVDTRAAPRAWSLRAGIADSSARSVEIRVESVMVSAFSKSGVKPKNALVLRRGRMAKLLSVDSTAGKGAFEVRMSVEATASTPGANHLTVVPNFQVD
jgi:hypothetical protein